MYATNIRPGDVVHPLDKLVRAVLLEPGSVTLIYGEYDLDADDCTYFDGDRTVEIDNNWPESGLAEPLIRVESGTTMLTLDGRLDDMILVWAGNDDNGYPLYAPLNNPSQAFDRNNERIFEYTVLDVKEKS